MDYFKQRISFMHADEKVIATTSRKLKPHIQQRLKDPPVIVPRQRQCTGQNTKRFSRLWQSGLLAQRRPTIVKRSSPTNGSLVTFDNRLSKFRLVPARQRADHDAVANRH